MMNDNKRRTGGGRSSGNQVCGYRRSLGRTSSKKGLDPVPEPSFRVKRVGVPMAEKWPEWSHHPSEHDEIILEEAPASPGS